jgi:hypothetical protein
MKKIIIPIALLLFFGLGIFFTQKYYTWKEVQVQEQSQVLLEKVKNVYKLVTVEGYFSEIYDYKDYWAYDFSIFRKKALVRVKAKVLVGYDLEGMKVEALPDLKKIIVQKTPDPSIIAVEHDLDYYDISEGTFNAFTKEDYNQLNANAKNFILEKAKESDLIQTAQKQGNQALEMMRFLVEGAGWELEVKKDLVNPSSVDKLLK